MKIDEKTLLEWGAEPQCSDIAFFNKVWPKGVSGNVAELIAEYQRAGLGDYGAMWFLAQLARHAPDEKQRDIALTELARIGEAERVARAIIEHGDRCGLMDRVERAESNAMGLELLIDRCPELADRARAALESQRGGA